MSNMIRQMSQTPFAMTWSLDRGELAVYVARQLGFFARGRSQFTAAKIARHLPDVQVRVEKC